jgi:hypothetical protein
MKIASVLAPLERFALPKSGCEGLVYSIFGSALFGSCLRSSHASACYIDEEFMDKDALVVELCHLVINSLRILTNILNLHASDLEDCDA